MPRRPPLRQPGQNGALPPLTFLHDILAIFAKARTHWAAFADTDLRRLLPLQAQLGVPAQALRGVDRISSSQVAIITRAEISIALRHVDLIEDADAALTSAAQSCDQYGAGIFSGQVDGCLTALACAMEHAGRSEEADDWMAHVKPDRADGREASLLGLARLSLMRGDYAAVVDHLLAHIPPDSGVWHPENHLAQRLLVALHREAPAQLDRYLAAAEPSQRGAPIALLLPHLLAEGELEAAAALYTRRELWMSDWFRAIARRGLAARDPDRLRRVIAVCEATAESDYARAFFARWIAYVDPDAARARMRETVERIPPDHWYWKRSNLIPALAWCEAALGDVPEALQRIDGITDRRSVREALCTTGRICLSREDSAGFEQVVAALETLRAEHTHDEVPKTSAALAALHREAGDHKASDAAFRQARGEAVALKNLNYSSERVNAIRTLMEAQREAGDLAGAVQTSRKIRNRGTRDNELRPLIAAYAEAGDLAGAARVMEGVKDVRQRGHMGAAALARWARGRVPYAAELVFVS